MKKDIKATKPLINMLNYITLPNDITTVYGSPSTGKTTFCFQCAANDCGKVIFIDTENSFNIERLQKMNPLLNLSNIILIRATRYSEQFKAVKSLSQMKNLSFVIIDSFTHYYRRKIQEGITINPPTIRMLQMLKELKIPIILTSQVYSDLNGNTKAIGGSLLNRYSEQTIKLEENEGKRKATLEKTKTEISFIITDKGLVV